jgi:hypothetical protein
MKTIMMMVIVVATSCATSHGGCNYAKAQKYNQKQMRRAERHRSYADNIHNPENEEYVNEIAFNEDISYEEVTQEMFNERYK